MEEAGALVIAADSVLARTTMAVRHRPGLLEETHGMHLEMDEERGLEEDREVLNCSILVCFGTWLHPGQEFQYFLLLSFVLGCWGDNSGENSSSTQVVLLVLHMENRCRVRTPRREPHPQRLEVEPLFDSVV